MSGDDERNPYAPPRADVRDRAEHPVDIDNLPVSRAWKSRFAAIQRAGGPRLPDVKSLPWRDRVKAPGFNFLAFLFGPFYYLSKGMWRKAITLFALCLVAVLVLGWLLTLLGFERWIKALGYGAAAVFASRANIDYYKKVVLGDNGWW